MRTKTLLEEHALKIDILSVGRLITHADLFIFGTKPFFEHVQGQIAIWPESYAGPFCSQRRVSYCTSNSNLPHYRIFWGCFINRERHTFLVQTHGKGESPDPGA